MEAGQTPVLRSAWSCGGTGWGPCRWSCTETKSEPSSSSECVASAGPLGHLVAETDGHGVWGRLLCFIKIHKDGKATKKMLWSVFVKVRKLPHCALDRLSWSQIGWPLQSVPLRHCSGPVQVGWCSLGHWCCLCVSSQTGSPLGRLEKDKSAYLRFTYVNICCIFKHATYIFLRLQHWILC